MEDNGVGDWRWERLFLDIIQLLCELDGDFFNEEICSGDLEGSFYMYHFFNVGHDISVEM